MGITARIEGLDLTITGLQRFGLDVREAAFYALIEALQKAFEACRDMINPTDHTLRQLAEMGHPYGFTHPEVIHEPDELVHRQSGAYMDALRAVSPRGSGDSIIEGTIDMGDDPTIQDLDRWIQDGTTMMRARPWMAWIMQHYGDDFADLIEARITAAISSAHGRAPFAS